MTLSLTFLTAIISKLSKVARALHHSLVRNHCPILFLILNGILRGNIGRLFLLDHIMVLVTVGRVDGTFVVIVVVARRLAFTWTSAIPTDCTATSPLVTAYPLS